jgi:hypothetical protein
MKIGIYQMDHWFIFPTMIYYNDSNVYEYKSIDFVFLKWGITFVKDGI